MRWTPEEILSDYIVVARLPSLNHYRRSLQKPPSHRTDLLRSVRHAEPP